GRVAGGRGGGRVELLEGAWRGGAEAGCCVDGCALARRGAAAAARLTEELVGGQDRVAHRVSWSGTRRGPRPTRATSYGPIRRPRRRLRSRASRCRGRGAAHRRSRCWTGRGCSRCLLVGYAPRTGSGDSVILRNDPGAAPVPSDTVVERDQSGPHRADPRSDP